MREKESTVNQYERFIAESNRIEGILREPTKQEVEEFERFMSLDIVTITDLAQFVRVYQPGAKLRDKKGMNVRVGNHVPLDGGPLVRSRLEGILDRCHTSGAYHTHIEYETLHPFTDGNGRSGRVLWAWQMQEFPLGFLHHFYYQALQNSR